MASISEIKQLIPDLHALAAHLGLERPGGRGNYRSPHHDDKTPSLSIHNNGQSWTDFSNGSDDSRGDAVDLVEYVNGVDTAEAIKFLHEWLGISTEAPKRDPDQKMSKAEWIARQCRPDGVDWRQRAMDYLVQHRNISDSVAKRAVDKGAVGWNTYTNPTRQPGEVGYGGEGIAFFVRDFNGARIVAVDMRYLDPDLNGGVKTQTQGEKDGVVWYSDLPRLKQAHTVYIVESPINVLSVESCGMPGVAAIAIRGNKRVVAGLDLAWLLGKRVMICCDFDEPDDHGHCAGQEAGWALHEKLTGLNVACHLVDQSRWQYNDVNDILIAEGAPVLKGLIRDQIQQWVIPGLLGDEEGRKGKPRLFLPSHDFSRYWKYRAKEDFTTHISKMEQNEDGGPCYVVPSMRESESQ